MIAYTQEKAKHFHETLQNIDNSFLTNNIKSALKVMRRLKDGFQAKNSLCREKDGSVINECDLIKQIWTFQFSELLPPARLVDGLSTATEEFSLQCEYSIPPIDARKIFIKIFEPTLRLGLGNVLRSWRRRINK